MTELLIKLDNQSQAYNCTDEISKKYGIDGSYFICENNLSELVMFHELSITNSLGESKYNLSSETFYFDIGKCHTAVILPIFEFQTILRTIKLVDVNHFIALIGGKTHDHFAIYKKIVGYHPKFFYMIDNINFGHTTRKLLRVFIDANENSLVRTLAQCRTILSSVGAPPTEIIYLEQLFDESFKCAPILSSCPNKYCSMSDMHVEIGKIRDRVIPMYLLSPKNYKYYDITHLLGLFVLDTSYISKDGVLETIINLCSADKYIFTIPVAKSCMLFHSNYVYDFAQYMSLKGNTMSKFQCSDLFRDHQTECKISKIRYFILVDEVNILMEKIDEINGRAQFNSCLESIKYTPNKRNMKKCLVELQKLHEIKIGECVAKSNMKKCLIELNKLHKRKILDNIIIELHEWEKKYGAFLLNNSANIV